MLKVCRRSKRERRRGSRKIRRHNGNGEMRRATGIEEMSEVVRAVLVFLY